MRITTQMLQASARKAGIPMNHMSLVNHLNGSSTVSSSLLNSLTKSNGVNQVQTKAYEKLQTSAEKLEQAADTLTAEELFEEARTSGDRANICKNTQQLLQAYNDTMKALKNAASPLNQYYRQMLKEAASEQEKTLQGFGITQEADGTLKLDESKLETADIDALEQMFGASGTFSSKVSFLADRISDNAKANTASASSRYNASGSSYFTQSNRYDFWG